MPLSQPLSWALWGSQEQQLVSDKEAVPGECQHAHPTPTPAPITES